jgi:tetratricopeptide (TPR) repeat protein
MRNCLAVATLAFALAGAAAQDLRVTWVEGAVTRASGATWIALKLDDPVAIDLTVKLEKDGYLELAGPGTKIAFSQPGSYQLKAIMAKRQGLDSGGLGKTVSRYITTLSNGPVSNAATIAGVRGAQQGVSDGSEWVTSDTAIYLEAAKAYISAGSYDLAIGQLKEGLLGALPEEAPELKFYLAEASALAGRTREAFGWMKSLTVAGGEEWAPDYWLLRAKLLVDTMAFQDAIDLLEGPAKAVAAIAQRESLYRLVLASAYRGLGDSANERAQLQRLVLAGANTEVGRAAAEILTGSGK